MEWLQLIRKETDKKKDNMLSHVEDSYPCNQCEHTTENKADIDKHIKSVHEECAQKEENKTVLRKHERPTHKRKSQLNIKEMVKQMAEINKKAQNLPTTPQPHHQQSKVSDESENNCTRRSVVAFGSGVACGAIGTGSVYFA